MGKVEDVGGVGVGKKFSAAFGGQKFTPLGMGPGEGGSKKFLWPGGYFTNKSWSIFFYWGGDFGEKWLPRGGEKIFGCLRRPKIYHPPGPSVQRRKGRGSPKFSS